MIHVGIDLHANNMVNVALNDNAEVAREAKLPTSQRSLEDFFGTFSEPVRAVVECIPKAFGILAVGLVPRKWRRLDAGPRQDGQGD